MIALQWIGKEAVVNEDDIQCFVASFYRLLELTSY